MMDMLNLFLGEKKEEPLPLLGAGEYRGIDISDECQHSFRLPLPSFSSPPLHILVSIFQPGMPYGPQDYKNKWMRLEGTDVISGWIPDNFYIETEDGKRYIFGWCNRQNPIVNPEKFRPVYRFIGEEKVNE